MKVPSAKKSKKIITKQQYDSVCKIVMPQLEKGLPPHLTYHNYKHVQLVIDATDYLLQKEKVAGEDRWMILTAALLHDIGFLRSYQNHEDLSCEIAKEMLPAYNFSEDCINSICQMIMATKLPQTPLDDYGKILCDADLFYLGTDSFFSIAGSLFQELKAIGFIKTEEEWEEKQLNFLHQHRYFTQTAIAELEPKKRAHVTMLEEEYKRGKQA